MVEFLREIPSEMGHVPKDEGHAGCRQTPSGVGKKLLQITDNRDSYSLVSHCCQII